ncbi:MAG: nitrous oxide reductase family maturation protein NosD, partial [Bacteroidota bacterium]
MAYNLTFSQVIEVCSGCAYDNINKAILAAKDYDTILIKKGTYKEHNIIVNKPLTLLGEEYPLIDGEFKGEIITVVADHVTID